MVNKGEALIARALDCISQHFGKRAILRGGMVLRILGSPRYTNDLDYVFVPYKSKKDIDGLAMQFRAALARLRP